MSLAIYKNNSNTPVVPVVNNGTNIYYPLIFDKTNKDYTSKNYWTLQANNGFFSARTDSYKYYLNSSPDRYHFTYSHWPYGEYSNDSNWPWLSSYNGLCLNFNQYQYGDYFKFSGSKANDLSTKYFRGKHGHYSPDDGSWIWDNDTDLRFWPLNTFDKKYQTTAENSDKLYVGTTAIISMPERLFKKTNFSCNGSVTYLDNKVSRTCSYTFDGNLIPPNYCFGVSFKGGSYISGNTASTTVRPYLALGRTNVHYTDSVTNTTIKDLCSGTRHSDGARGYMCHYLGKDPKNSYPDNHLWAVKGVANVGKMRETLGGYVSGISQPFYGFTTTHNKNDSSWTISGNVKYTANNISNTFKLNNVVYTVTATLPNIDSRIHGLGARQIVNHIFDRVSANINTNYWIYDQTVRFVISKTL